MQDETVRLRVGYSKKSLTPAEPVALFGYVPGRIYKRVLDDVYMTCVAISDSYDNTVLMYSMDAINMDLEIASSLRMAVSEITEVPADHVFITSTHTHSAPSCGSYGDGLQQAAVQTAQEALADRKTAKMFFGVDHTEGISFVRHYFSKDGSVVTVNHGKYDDPSLLTGHTHDPDTDMRVLRFQREGGKDVILANWQCHNLMTGGSRKFDLSADIVGKMRAFMEQDLDCLFAYFQGGAGNINPTSYIRSEEVNTTRDYSVTGRLMADTAMRAMEHMVPLKTGPMTVLTDTYIAAGNKEDLDKLDIAEQIVQYYKDGHTTVEANAYAASLKVGLYSYYHARYLQRRANAPDTVEMPLGVVVMGDFAWSTMPGECFDTAVKYIRDHSPYTYNFAAAYTNASPGYVPTKEAWDHGCYEVDATFLAPGTAEVIVERILHMLNVVRKA